MSKDLLRSTSLVAALTFISRVLGFIRDLLNASLFGAGAGMDAFLVAWRIPNFMRRLFAEGAFSQAFVPVFTETRSTRSEEEQRHLVNVVSGTLGGVLLLVTLVGLVGAPVLLGLFAPGFGSDPHKYHLGAHLLRITFPYLMLISMTALSSGILNSHGRFAIPAVTPVILNICMIAVVLIDSHSVEVLAWAVLLAGFLQFGFQLPWIARLHLLGRPQWAWHDPEVRRIIRLMVPILFGSSVAQISLLLDTILASFLATGSVSWLYYADRIMEFPLGLFSIAVATVILPNLSGHHAKRAPEAFSDTLDWGLRAILVIGTPAMLALVVLAGPLVATLFLHGDFHAHDVVMTEAALVGFSFGFMGFSLVKVLVPGFYARQETRIPVRYGVTALGIGMASSVVFVGGLLLMHFPAPHLGLALSTTVNSWVNAMLLFRRLRRDQVYRPRPGWRRFAIQLFIANLCMTACIWWLAGDLAHWIAMTKWQRVEHMTEVMVVGVLVYAAALGLSGMRPTDLRHEAA